MVMFSWEQNGLVSFRWFILYKHGYHVTAAEVRAPLDNRTPAIVGNSRTESMPAPTSAAAMSERMRPLRTPISVIATTIDSVVAE